MPCRENYETDERMMVRLLAFALYAGDALVFGNGMGSGEEPDLWQKDLTGAIERWIEVGLPDERLIRKACGRADEVVVVSYGRAAGIWWNKNRDKLQRPDNLTVLNLPPEATQPLAALASRTMQLQCTIQEGHVMVTSEAGVLEMEPKIARQFSCGQWMTAGKSGSTLFFKHARRSMAHDGMVIGSQDADQLLLPFSCRGAAAKLPSRQILCRGRCPR